MTPFEARNDYFDVGQTKTNVSCVIEALCSGGQHKVVSGMHLAPLEPNSSSKVDILT